MANRTFFAFLLATFMALSPAMAKPVPDARHDSLIINAIDNDDEDELIDSSNDASWPRTDTTGNEEELRINHQSHTTTPFTPNMPPMTPFSPTAPMSNSTSLSTTTPAPTLASSLLPVLTVPPFEDTIDIDATSSTTHRYISPKAGRFKGLGGNTFLGQLRHAKIENNALFCLFYVGVYIILSLAVAVVLIALMILVSCACEACDNLGKPSTLSKLRVCFSRLKIFLKKITSPNLPPTRAVTYSSVEEIV